MTNEMIAFLNTATTAELLELNRAVVARIKYAQKMNQVRAGPARRAGNQFTVGEIVSFISKRTGMPIKGRITKINTETAKVDCAANGIWSISPGLLKKVV